MEKEFSHTSFDQEESPTRPDLDDQKKAEDIEDSNDSTQKKESAERKDSALLAEGEALLREIGSVPEDHHIDTKYKMLFATIEDTDDNSGLAVPPHHNATFSSLGLEYKGKRYPYREEIKLFVHQAACDAKRLEYLDQKELVEEIDSINSAWKGPLTANLRKHYRSEARKEYREEYNKMVAKIKKLESDNSWKQKGLGLSEEEREFKHDYRENRDALIRDFGKKFRKTRSDYINKRLKSDNEEEEYIEKCLKNYTYDIGLEYYNSLENKGSKVARALYMDLDTSNEHCQDVLNDILSHRPIEKSVESKKKILNYLGEKVPNGVNELIPFINKVEKMANRKYKEVLPKYAAAQNNPNLKEIYRLREELEAFSEQKDRYIDEHTNRHVKERIEEIEKGIMALVTPGTLIDGTRKIGIMPTGVILASKYGPEYSVGIKDGEEIRTFSPLDPGIMRLFADESEAELWRETWNNVKDQGANRVDEALWGEISKMSEDYQDDFDAEASALLKKYHVAPPKLLELENGEFHDCLQPEDLELLKSILPVLSPFVDGIKLTRGEPTYKTENPRNRGKSPTDGEKATLRETRLEILKFLTGHDPNLNKLILVSEGRTVDIGTFGRLVQNAGPEKSDKAIARLTLELGMSIYNDIGPLKRRQFAKMLGNKTNISAPEFYNIFKENVPNLNQRRRLVERAFFLTEFNKFIKGTPSTKGMIRFFESIKHNTPSEEQ